MLLGCDISHHQNPNLFSYANAGSFAIVKASEGASYADDCAKTHIKNARANRMLTGLYHYARAERNTAENEALQFAKIVNQIGGENLLALDIEADSFKNSAIDIWAHSFCKRVEELTGVLPLIYVSAAYAKLFKKCASANIGLWLAWYNGVPETVSGKYEIPWDTVALHQYTSTPYDKDAFFGNAEAWRKYAGVDVSSSVISGDTPEDAKKSADLLNELEELVNKYKSLD